MSLDTLRLLLPVGAASPPRMQDAPVSFPARGGGILLMTRLQSANWQFTTGFQSANMPEELCRHTRAWSAHTSNASLNLKG